MVGLDARSTMDIDAAVKGATVSIEEAENMIASIISVPVDDGVKFCISIRVIRPRKNRADNLVQNTHKGLTRIIGESLAV